MDAIVTVVGKDQVGIIAGVTHELSQAGINILTISQTILDQYFTMIMKVDLGGLVLARQDLNARLETAGMRLGVQITLINEDVLKAMHRI
jgi:ACT domain-containing protein